MPVAVVYNITVETIRPSNRSGSLQAFVNIVVNGIKISDARIVDGAKGLFVAMPQRSWQNGQGETKYSNIVEIVDKDLAEAIQRQVIDAWRKQ
jgi:DNA-binding cell septation regulator SpoVG